MMANRRINGISILSSLALVMWGTLIATAGEASGQSPAAAKGAPSLTQNWLDRWQRNILADLRNRYCDREMGEEIGWLVSPFESGFFEGYQATHDTKWLDLLVDWGDSWIARGSRSPMDSSAGPRPRGPAPTRCRTSRPITSSARRWVCARSCRWPVSFARTLP